MPSATRRIQRHPDDAGRRDGTRSASTPAAAARRPLHRERDLHPAGSPVAAFALPEFRDDDAQRVGPSVVARDDTGAASTPSA